MKYKFLYWINITSFGDPLEQEDMKKQAAEKALEFVEDGMTLGLGTGTTVKYMFEKLADMVKDGLEIEGNGKIAIVGDGVKMALFFVQQQDRGI